MRLFLIGYMGCGKSAIGKKIAETLNMNFIDLDDYIEMKSGKSIVEIFEAEGEEKFRTMEKNCLLEVIKNDNAVISLGGGTPCFHNNIDVINNHGTSVYIEMTAEALSKRLIKARKKRPLIQGMNETDLRFYVENNLKKRHSFYKQAHYTINCENQNIEEMAKLIIETIHKSKPHIYHP